MKRDAYFYIKDDLNKKLVFLVGPRQVGKTWLSNELQKDFTRPLYLNYDNATHRKIMKDYAWGRADMIVLDEVHKMRGWKSYVKGVFDTRKDMKILVTGSATLDAHKHAGDSLAGRYFTHHLLPFTVHENITTRGIADTVKLFERSGFPEPFLAVDNTDVNRWRETYIDSVVREDAMTIHGVENFFAFRAIFNLLRERVGSPISYASIAENVGISPATVKKYIHILEALYVVFRVQPYTHKIARSILKEPKLYFFDAGLVNGDGARFENMLALELYAYSKRKQDREGKAYTLATLRTKEGNEIDFALIDERNTLLHLVEAKMSDNTPTKALRYFTEKYNVRGSQVLFSQTTTHSPTSHINVYTIESFVKDVLE